MGEQSVLIRSCVYYALCALLFTLFFVADAIGAAFLLPLIFITILINPQHTPWVGIFCISLFQDTLSNIPLGVHGSLYGLYGLFLMSQRKYLFKRAFFFTWVIFAITTLAFLGVREGFLMGVMHLSKHPVNLVTECSFLALMFPLLFRFLTWVHVTLSARHES